MITFILNNKTVTTDKHPGTSLLDFIRTDQNLKGTKIGCREGDCGACTVLQGTLQNGTIDYKSIVSCLTPLGNAQGKHIVTLEGINQDRLTPVQQAMSDHAATQCGFCTPGFVMSFTGYAINAKKPITKEAIDAIGGNICRCTGYKSIERAAETIVKALDGKKTENPIEWLIKNNFLPNYFKDIPGRLSAIVNIKEVVSNPAFTIGGGTDLMVQIPDKISENDLHLMADNPELKTIDTSDNGIKIGASCTANQIAESTIIYEYIPGLKQFFKLISSEPVRNMGTIAGNIMNASPIGDLSITFLALDASLVLSNGSNNRTVKLHDFFIDYKKTDLKPDEIIESVIIPKKEGKRLFNFEKVSKRTHLDIASVCSAIHLKTDGKTIQDCRISMGGIKAIPLYLAQTSKTLKDKALNPESVKQAIETLQKEIQPISDVRGTIDYKKLLARQLLIAHFIELFPDTFTVQNFI